MNKTPIARAVKEYIGKDFSRFHMPGHKGKPIHPFGDATCYDVTEVAGTDSLYEASECIMETENAFAALYGVKCTLLSAGGSTLSIQTMLALVAKENAPIIASRNIHVSAVNAMALLNLLPHWVYPPCDDTGLGLGGAVTSKQIEIALKQCPDAVAVYLTSPNFFGIMADIKSISDVCKKYDVPLLVDNAHGSALKFYPNDLHPMTLGADMCCDSLHKTLPALTGAGLLHINHPRFIPYAKKAMSMFGSTSPSYMIMLSCDTCLAYIRTKAREDLASNIECINKFKSLALSKGFTLPQGLVDEGRLTLVLNATGYTKETFRQHLEEHHIEAEYVGDSGCVFLVSPFNSQKDMARLENMINTATCDASNLTFFPVTPPTSVLTLRQAFFSEKEEIDVNDSLNRIVAEIIAPCPPGIPVVMNGEKITSDIQKLLLMYGIKHIIVVK